MDGEDAKDRHKKPQSSLEVGTYLKKGHPGKSRRTSATLGTEINIFELLFGASTEWGGVL